MDIENGNGKKIFCGRVLSVDWAEVATLRSTFFFYWALFTNLDN
jgi:hypothetical protein